ncbi:hypothetical protein QJ48_05525 [Paenibacillus sp. A3]|nr:hypothetical protein QJ48_05525 [Paenibacillus sp. A3]
MRTRAVFLDFGHRHLSSLYPIFFFLKKNKIARVVVAPINMKSISIKKKIEPVNNQLDFSLLFLFDYNKIYIFNLVYPNYTSFLESAEFQPGAEALFFYLGPPVRQP